MGIAELKSLQRATSMTIDKVRQLYESEPFRPFSLNLADGREVVVQHPEFLAQAPSGRTIVVYQPDDSFNIVDLQLVTDLDVKAGSKPKKSK